MNDKPKCELCGEPMPEGEEMFKYHGYSGSCPKPPLPRSATPRTDAIKFPSEVLLPAHEKHLGYSVREAVKILGDHARQLERELAATCEERDSLRMRVQDREIDIADCNQLRAEAVEERDRLLDVLQRNGFVRCDIPACNCGSWHARYGLPERWEEIKDALTEAGHHLCNENGHLVSKALSALIEERDRYKADSEALDFLIEHVRQTDPYILPDSESVISDPETGNDVPIPEHLRKRLEGK